MKKFISILLLIAIIFGIVPFYSQAAKSEQPIEISAKAMKKIKDDVWSVIDDYEDDNIKATRGKKVTSADYAAITYEIEALVKQTETYVEGSIVRNGDFFTWETTEGIVCGYSPELRYRESKVDTTKMAGENVTTISYATKGSTPTGKDVYLISPYYNDSYSADSSFTDQYKKEGKSIASATGGTFTQYGYTQATVTNVAKAIQSGAVVLFDSHGITDYSNGDDYVSRANTSYLCLNTGTGITNADMAAVSGTYGTYYHAFNGGSSTYCVDGTAMSNHMTANAPSSIVWMAICLGMATNGLNKPLRAKGVEVVYGYSQSVSFTGDYKYEASFWNSMKNGKTVAQACSTMKSSYGKWDPAYSSYSESNAKKNYVAFPIVASSEDVYPGQGKVDAVQTVKSTWTLFQQNGSSTTTCNHSNTTKSTTNATCTSTGKTTETCKLCGAVVSTTTIPALGHSYKYTSSNNGTHKVTCTRCTYSSNANCTYSNNVCKYCGYTKTNNTTVSISSGKYVIAAKVNGVYYAMSNSFASKISSKTISVSNGTIAESAASSCVVTITKSGSYYTISNGSKYLKYSSSTNFSSSTTAYNWSITSGVNGTYRIIPSGASTRGIVFYRSTSKFGAYATSNASSTSNYYYDVELIPVTSSSNSSSSNNSSTSTRTYELVTSSSDLTAGTYIIIANADGTYAGNYNYYALSTNGDGSYAAMSAVGIDLDNLPSKLTCDISSVPNYEWTMTGSRTSFKLATGNKYLAATSGSTKLSVGTTASSWSATYSSAYKGFRVKASSRYISLRDDISTVGKNGNPLFCTVSSTSSGTTYLHFYKLINQ